MDVGFYIGIILRQSSSPEIRSMSVWPTKDLDRSSCTLLGGSWDLVAGLRTPHTSSVTGLL